MTTCTKCGRTDNEEGSCFCVYCGEALVATQLPPTLSRYQSPPVADRPIGQMIEGKYRVKRLLEVTEKTGERDSSDIFSFAVMVGLMALFITGLLPGGLTSVQGFLVGFFAVILLYVALAVLESRRSQPPESHKIRLDSPAGVSITQTESENGVTIQIYVNKGVALSRGTDNG